MFIKLTPVTEQMLITFSEMHKKDMKLVMDYVVNHWELNIDDERFTQDWIQI
jgi:glycosidase